MRAERASSLRDDFTSDGLPTIPFETDGNGHSNRRKDFLGEDKGTARCWPDILMQLPEDFGTSGEYSDIRKFVLTYVRGQVKLATGKPTKARGIIEGLAGKPGFLEFEESNEPLFAAIDIAVRGETNRIEDFNGDPIKPSFKKVVV